MPCALCPIDPSPSKMAIPDTCRPPHRASSVRKAIYAYSHRSHHTGQVRPESGLFLVPFRHFPATAAGKERLQSHLRVVTWIALCPASAARKWVIFLAFRRTSSGSALLSESRLSRWFARQRGQPGRRLWPICGKMPAQMLFRKCSVTARSELLHQQRCPRRARYRRVDDCLLCKNMRFHQNLAMSAPREPQGLRPRPPSPVRRCSIRADRHDLCGQSLM